MISESFQFHEFIPSVALDITHRQGFNLTRKAKIDRQINVQTLNTMPKKDDHFEQHFMGSRYKYKRTISQKFSDVSPVTPPLDQPGSCYWL